VGPDSEAAAEKAGHRRLFRKGAKLWPGYRAKCHIALPGSEKAPYQWDQVIMHMRTLWTFSCRRLEGAFRLPEGAIGLGSRHSVMRG